MRDSKDLYRILGVGPSASAGDIRQAYRTLVRHYHPDANPGNTAAFRAVTLAYEVLSDPDRRTRYDRLAEPGQVEASPATGSRPVRARGTGPIHGAAVATKVEVSLGEAIRGCRVMLTVPTHERCAKCDGLGVSLGSPVQPCADCRGRGYTPDVAELEVNIPQGADDETMVRIPGRGAPGLRGGTPGDLMVEVRVRAHPLVRRDGLDLTLRLPVTMGEAYCGATVEIPSFFGSAAVVIPPRSQTGTRLRVKKMGVRRSGLCGDLYVELDVRVPDQDNRELARALRRAETAYRRPVRSGMRL